MERPKISFFSPFFQENGSKNCHGRASTGSPEDLAERLGMSRSSLFELIAFLKEEMRAPIIYSKNRQSYMYEYPPNFYLGFEHGHLHPDEMIDNLET